MSLTKFSLLKRRIGTSRADFLRHWRTTHVDVLVNRARHKAYNRRYVQVEFLALPGLGDEAFDGTAQMVPQSPAIVQQGFQHDPLYAQHVRPDEELFLDVPGCAVVYCESDDLGAVDATGAALKALLLVQRESGTSPDCLRAGWRDRAHALLADASHGLRGIRQHRVLPGAATGMQGGAVLQDAPDLVEELFFDDLAALQAFCTSEAFAASFRQHGARALGQGSHVFAAQEHLIYADA